MNDLQLKRRLVRQRLIEENEFPDIPESWEVERLRFLFKESKERNGESPVGEMLSVSEYRGVVPREYEHEEQRRTNEELENYRVVKPGQLAVNSMWLNHLGLGVSEYTGHVSPAYNVYDISERLDQHFVHHLVRSNYYLKIYLRYLYGIRPNSFQIKSYDWASIPIIVPDLATQRQIADFLDRETARIDLLIEKKQRLVALLEGQHASIVSTAVTVGLDENAELVPTSSQYLPRVPSTWRVWRLKHLADIRGGLTLGRQTPIDVETVMTPYMRVANVQAGWLKLSDVAELLVTEIEIKRYRLEHGDVLMNEGGDNDKLGRGAVWKSEIDTCVHQNHVFAVRPYDKRYSEWISLTTNARYARDFFFLHSNQSTNLASISKTNLTRFPIAVPPLVEMQTTLAILRDRIGKLDQINEKTNASIDRLKEYRSALITAAVTGQIDVTTYAKSGTPDRRLDAIQEELGA